MADYEINAEDIIDYSPNGDDVDSFSQKTKRSIERIFELLKALNDALSSLSQEQLLVKQSTTTNYLKRLVGELHLALAIANLDTTGYDSLLTKFDFGINGYFTTPEGRCTKVTSAVKDSTTITVDSIDGLIIGGNYLLKSEDNIQTVKITGINTENGNAVTLSSPVQFVPNIAQTILIRNRLNVVNENVIVDGDNYFVTNPIIFINKETGESKTISSVHLNVKHQNIKDPDIFCEVALLNDLKFASGEVIGVGNGGTQTVTLANTNKIQNWGFTLYFNGVKQTSGYKFSPSNGAVTFKAASNVIATADYYYNWDEENFRPMTSSGTYVDYKNPSRATTQFTYYGLDSNTSGNAAIIRMTMKRGTGGVANESLGTSTGSVQGFKLPHHAIRNSIVVSPTSAAWNWNDNLDVLTVTASAGQNISVAYNYLSKSYYVDSFAVMFNE